MDASTIIGIILSLFGIALSIVSIVIAYLISNNSDKTLTAIEQKISEQHTEFLKMLRDERKAHDERTERDLQKMIDMTQTTIQFVMDIRKEGLPKEKVDDHQQLKEATLRLKPNPLNSAPIFSKESKVE